MPNPPRPLLYPFRAIRPAPGRAGDVIAPPYDVVRVDEARVLAADRPWSFLHVSRAEIDLPPGSDPYAPQTYAKSAANWQQMLDQGILVRDEQPGFYVYRMVSGDQVQTGIAATVSIAAYEQGRVKRHELTRPDKEDDRVQQIEVLNAQTGPVLLTCRPSERFSQLLLEHTSAPPDIDAIDHEGIRHSLWSVSESTHIERLAEVCNQMDTLYIADGHHRTAAAARVAGQRMACDSNAGAQADCCRFLAVLFPADEMRVLPYHRLVTDLGQYSAAAFLEAVAGRMDVAKVTGAVAPDQPGCFGMYLAGSWYRLACRPGDPSLGVVAALDTSLLSDQLLEPILQIADLRTDQRMAFVGGVHGTAALERKVDSGEADVAFSLRATTVEELMAVADAGFLMPSKTTWFEPKLADGLLSHGLDQSS